MFENTGVKVEMLVFNTTSITLLLCGYNKMPHFHIGFIETVPFPPNCASKIESWYAVEFKGVREMFGAKYIENITCCAEI